MSILPGKKDESLFIRRHQSFGERKIINSTEISDSYVHGDVAAPRLSPRSSSHALLVGQEVHRRADKKDALSGRRYPKILILLCAAALILGVFSVLHNAL